jgi:hypothetical protein
MLRSLELKCISFGNAKAGSFRTRVQVRGPLSCSKGRWVQHTLLSVQPRAKLHPNTAKELHLGGAPKRALIVVALFVLTHSQPAIAACVCSSIEEKIEDHSPKLLNKYVSWALCIRVSERSFDDYPVRVVAPKGISEYGLLASPDARAPKDNGDAASPPMPQRYDLWSSSNNGAAEHNQLVENVQSCVPGYGR